LIVAVPVGPARTMAAIAKQVDVVVCLAKPTAFRAIGTFYQDFSPAPR
jgi:predicted phosphoribosyltransferase